MKKILLISTGGTIATKKTDHGLTPQLTSDEILESVPQVREFCQVTPVQLFNIDSSNMQPENWVRIAEKIQETYDQYDGFLITHGTDTTSYSMHRGIPLSTHHSHHNYEVPLRYYP